MVNKIRFELSERTQRTLIRGIRRLSKRDKLFKALLRVFNRLGNLAQAYGTKKFLSGASGGSGLRRRTGSLAKSFMGGAVQYKGLPAVRVGVLKGPAEEYAHVHEYGTKGKGGKLPDIRPKKAKYLAVPLWSKAAGFGSNRAVTDAGVSMFSSPREYPGQLRFVSIRGGGAGGSAALYDDDDFTNNEPIPGQATYLMLRKVSIKPRPFAEPSLRHAMKFADGMIYRMLDEMLSGDDE